MANEIILPLPGTRQAAIQLGLRFWFDGGSCRKGHIAERYVKDNDCMDCRRAREQQRKLARDAGQVTYDGTVCRKNPQHGTLKYMVHGTCVDCAMEHSYAMAAEKTASRKAARAADPVLAEWDALTPKEKRSRIMKSWRDRNKERVAEYDKQYKAEQLKTNPQFILRHAIRTRLNIAVRRGDKGGSAVRDLGCTIAEFKVHIEAQFRDGMSWDNWGEWELDHVLELALFDLTDREQFLKAVHYTNYQPLWKAENLAKRPELGRGKLGATQRSIRKKVPLPDDDLFAGSEEINQ